MYDARAVANYFLDRAETNNGQLSILTLLKILYFAHAWYLVKHNRPLIAQPFEAWRHGPVNRVVYDQYKGYGSKPIDKKATTFDAKSARFIAAPYAFDEGTETFLGNIFDYYCKFHPFRLSDLTHEAGGPWDVIWASAEKSAVPGMVIPNELIARWFAARNALYWTDREGSLPT
jgi:uncharacterized phage-associated protein